MVHKSSVSIIDESFSRVSLPGELKMNLSNKQVRNAMIIGFIIGLAVGVGMGAAMGNIAVGIGAGSGIGVALGAGFAADADKKAKKSGDGQ
jgi:hypothetical protein